MKQPISCRPTGPASKQVREQVHVPTREQRAEPKPPDQAGAEAKPAPGDEFVGSNASCCGQSPCCCGSAAKPADAVEGAPKPGLELLRSHSLLKVGSSGDEVSLLQQRLGLEASGTFDDATKAAVVEYQRAQNIRVDGLVGQQTWGRLLGIQDELKPGIELLGTPASAPVPASEPALNEPPTAAHSELGTSAPPEPTPVEAASNAPARPATPPQAPSPAPASKPQSNGAVASLFERIDGNDNGLLSAGEVRAMVQRAGVGGGFFGGMKVDGATTQLMSAFDRNGNGAVKPSELRSGMQTLLAQTMGNGASRGQYAKKTLDWFNRIDANHNGSVTESELKSRVQSELERKGESMASVKAEVLARIGVHLLGRSRRGAATRDEVERLAQDLDVG